MKKLITSLIVLHILYFFACMCSEDPGPADDDDPEGDCWAFHRCHPGGSLHGYCIEKKGHAGRHLCGRCGKRFDYQYDDEE